MKKKGFTLVELLAVIAILAILVIIALPNIMSMFNEAKKSTFTTELKNIYRGAEQAYVKDAFKNSGTKVYSKCKSGCTNELDMNVRDDLEYYIEINSSGKIVKLYARDNSYQYKHDGELSINDIESVEVIADVEEPIKITSSGLYHKPEITSFCFYTGNGKKYSSYKINCLDNLTIKECLNNSQHIESPDIVYSYSSQFDTCVKNAIVTDVSSGCGYLKGAENINACYNNYANKESIPSSTTVYDVKDKCISLLDRGTVVNCCLDGESEIEVYDRKKKRKIKKKLKDITYDDLILCWDFDLGKFTYQKPVWIMKEKLINSCLVLKFSDGSYLKVPSNPGDHRIYNLDKEMFTSCKSDIDTPVGMKTINSKNEIITLISKEEVMEEITICNVVTYKDINMYANGILTSRGSNNLYKISNMRFIKDNRETLSREDLPNVSNEIFYGLRLGERDISVYGSKENAIKELTVFAKDLENTKKS